MFTIESREIGQAFSNIHNQSDKRPILFNNSYIQCWLLKMKSISKLFWIIKNKRKYFKNIFHRQTLSCRSLKNLSSLSSCLISRSWRYIKQRHAVTPKNTISKNITKTRPLVGNKDSSVAMFMSNLH